MATGPARSLLNPIIPNNLSLNDKQCEKLIDEVATDKEVFANFIAAGNGHQKLKDRWDQIANRLNPAGPAKKTGEKWKESWEGLKTRAKKAYAQKLEYMRGTGGGVAPELKNLGLNPGFERVIALLNPLTITGNQGVPNPLMIQQEAGHGGPENHSQAVAAGMGPVPVHRGHHETQGQQQQQPHWLQHGQNMLEPQTAALGNGSVPVQHGYPVSHGQHHQQHHRLHHSPPTAQAVQTAPGPVLRQQTFPTHQMEQQHQWPHQPQQGHAPQEVLHGPGTSQGYHGYRPYPTEQHQVPEHAHWSGPMQGFQNPQAAFAPPGGAGLSEHFEPMRAPPLPSTPHRRAQPAMPHTPPFGMSPARNRLSYTTSSNMAEVAGGVGNMVIRSGSSGGADVEHLTETMQLLNATLSSVSDVMEGLKTEINSQTAAMVTLSSAVDNLSSVRDVLVSWKGEMNTQTARIVDVLSACDNTMSTFKDGMFGDLVQCLQNFNDSLKVLSKLSEQED